MSISESELLVLIWISLTSIRTVLSWLRDCHPCPCSLGAINIAQQQQKHRWWLLTTCAREYRPLVIQHRLTISCFFFLSSKKKRWGVCPTDSAQPTYLYTYTHGKTFTNTLGKQLGAAYRSIYSGIYGGVRYQEVQHHSRREWRTNVIKKSMWTNVDGASADCFITY